MQRLPHRSRGSRVRKFHALVAAQYLQGCAGTRYRAAIRTPLLVTTAIASIVKTRSLLQVRRHC